MVYKFKGVLLRWQVTLLSSAQPGSILSRQRLEESLFIRNAS